MKVLITGGTGFIGSRLAIKCLEKGDYVRIFGQVNNDSEEENRKLIEEKGVDVVLGSIVDKEKISNVVQDIEVVYHLAAAQHEVNVPDQVFWDVNVTGTKTILEASVKEGIKRFVHGSTIGVYGSLGGVIDEDSPSKPDNIYGATKLEGEKCVLSFKEKLPVVIIRISETYGPGDRRLLKLFKTIKKNVFFMIGDGKNLHHLIYVDDLIEGMFLAANGENAPGQIFLLVGKEPITTNDMVKIISTELGIDTPKFRAPLFPFLILATIMETIMRPLGIQPPLHRRRMDFFKKSFAFSTDNASKTLGFLPKISFRQGVSETVKWYNETGHL